MKSFASKVCLIWGQDTCQCKADCDHCDWLIKLRENFGWVKCPKCGKKRAYLMSDSHNLWCVECKAIVE